MKNIIRIFLYSFITLLATTSVIFAWNGLVAENGDYLTTAKWNELLLLLQNKQDSSNATNRDDADINTTRYYGTSYTSGKWKVDRETGIGTGTIRVTALSANNPAQADYATAWWNRASLIY